MEIGARPGQAPNRSRYLKPSGLSRPGACRSLGRGVGVCASFLLLAAAFLLTSCSYYATFSSKVKELDFTFQYPRGWWVSDVEQYPHLVTVSILSPAVSGNESSLKVELASWPGTGADINLQAQERVDHVISIDEGQRNFKLVKNDTIDVDGSRGYLVEYTLDHLAKEVPRAEQRTYIPIHWLRRVVPRNGRVYEISMSASQNEWDRRANDIQHILDTFRWK